MAVRPPLTLADLVAAATVARDRARLLRQDALTAQWRAGGTRQVHRDLRLALVWTLYQKIRREEGERIAAGGILRCGHPSCRIPGCGRPDC